MEHPSFYQLIVTDDGTDATPASSSNVVEGMGLASMRERVEALGERTAQLCAAAREVRRDVIFVAHGGPFEGPKEVQHCYDRTDVDGFLAASSVERLPVEPVLADVVQSYKNLRLKR